MAARTNSTSKGKWMMKDRSDVSFLAKCSVDMQIDWEKHHHASGPSEKNKIESHMEETYHLMGRFLNDLKSHQNSLPEKAQNDLDELQDVYATFSEKKWDPGILEVFSFNLGRLSWHLG